MENTSENKEKNTKRQITEHLSIGLLAHVDAGKTTLSEAVLYLTGSIRRLGRVDNRDAFLDTYEQERARGITIFSKQAVFPLGDKSVTLLDTPGHVDFSAEMERTLQVLDYGILVISGPDGVQSHTETLWRLLKRWGIPVFVFINKMDLAGADAGAIMEELKSRLDENCVDFTQGEISGGGPGRARAGSPVNPGAEGIPLLFWLRFEAFWGGGISAGPWGLYGQPAGRGGVRGPRI